MFDALFAMTALSNLHPALVHFPIALSAVALLFDQTSVRARRLASDVQQTDSMKLLR